MKSSFEQNAESDAVCVAGPLRLQHSKQLDLREAGQFCYGSWCYYIHLIQTGWHVGEILMLKVEVIPKRLHVWSQSFDFCLSNTAGIAAPFHFHIGAAAGKRVGVSVRHVPVLKHEMMKCNIGHISSTYGTPNNVFSDAHHILTGTGRTLSRTTLTVVKLCTSTNL